MKILICVFVTALCGAAAAARGVNLAPVAEPSTSHVSRDTSLAALHDGHAPKTSHVRGKGSYGNWPSKGTQWVQYDWTAPVRTRKIDVFWWDDRGGVRVVARPKLDIRAAGKTGIRITIQPHDSKDKFPYTPALVERDYPKAVISLRELDSAFEPVKAKVGQMNVTVQSKPLSVQVTTLDNGPLQKITFAPDGTMSFVLDDQPVLGMGEGGPKQTGDSWRTDKIELDRRGRLHPMTPWYGTGTYGSSNPVPLMVGTGGWGMFIPTPWGAIDLSDAETGKFIPAEPIPPGTVVSRGQQREGRIGMPPPEAFIPGTYDVFVFDAQDPPAFMKDVSTLSGQAVLPPKWVMGYQQSHRNLKGETQMLEIIDTFRKKNIPLDSVCYLGTGFCPSGWNKHQPSFEFNPKVFKRAPKEVLADMHDRNVRVMAHMIPWDRDRLATIRGTVPPKPGEKLDNTHIQNYWNEHNALVDAGVDAWWPDEGDWFSFHERMKRHELYYTGPLSKQPNVRPWSLHRNGYLGVARWGGWMWPGDPLTTWRTLQTHIAIGINHSLSVSPFWNSDIGAFYTTDEYSAELYVRWVQFAAFNSLMRSHGRGWENRLPWTWGLSEPGPGEGSYVQPKSEMNNPTVEPIAKKYIELRYQLLSYNYTLAWQARETGMPMMRSMWLHYPTDPKVRSIGDQYLWGRDLLIAPVYKKGATAREVYLPAGKWHDWWTGKLETGGRTVQRSVDLATMPIYVRAGAIVPLDPIRQYTSQVVDQPTTLKIYQGADGQTTLYDDDGISLDYLKGSSVETLIQWDDAAKRLTIEPQAKGGPKRTFKIELIPDGTTKEIRYAGQRLEVNLSTTTAPCAEQQAELATSELTCEYATNPLGVDTPQPRLGWLLKSDKRSQLQSAYRVLVATSEKQLQANVGDKWDSGKVNSDQSMNVDYQGKALTSEEKCYWKVRVWDKQGQPSTWSQPGSFEMGLMKQSDWKGKWIGIAASSPLAKQQEAAAMSGRVNVALPAKPSTSFVSGHETLNAVNDGFRPANSNDKRYGAYGNWAHRGVHWVQYEWPKPVNVDGIDVYWFSDKGGVRLPKASRLLYWDGTAFVPVKNPIGLGVEGDRYNTTTFDEVTTSKLKLEFDSGEASTGILEFKVYDAGKSPKFPPVVKVNRFVALANAANAPSPLLRKEFAVTKKVRRARVRFSGLGWSELYINGKKVSDDVLSPSLTDYSKEVLYRTYDVTSFLKPGTNAIGMMLGNGWYSATSILPWEKGGPWGDGPRAILQMTVTYDDGTEKRLVTDETWKASAGAIGSNQLIAGEAYDARDEKPNWSRVGYDDLSWSNAAVRPAPKGGLRNQPVPSMKVQDTIKPIKMTKHADGGWLFEFDRYFSGWVRLKVTGKAGAKITIHYELDEKDMYILKGDPKGETYEPRFTIHPVRYVRVEGLEGPPTFDTLTGREVYSDVEMHGHFSCSNPLLNQIHGNIQRTLKVALKGFVLDCLHREPIFYNEPASYFGSLSARKYIPNLWTDVARSIPLAGSENGDLSDIVPRLPGMNRQSDVSQNAAYPMLVWYLYQCHGDQRLLEQHYDSVKAWVDFIGRELAGDHHIVTKGWLGEHMLPGQKTGHWEFISKETPKDFIWTCFYYHNTRTLTNMCQVLGKKEEEERYAKLAQEIRAVINKTWLDSKTGHYATKSQTSEILPLALDIVPQENKKQLIENIAKTITETDGGKLRVGHVGLPGFMESLVENGLGQIVYDAVNHTEFPGWGYMIDQGATTVWESWGMLKGGYHAEESMTMLADVGRFFYESIAGIQEPPYYGTAPFGPGYRRFYIKPHALGDLKHAEASIKTVRGIISSSWKRTKNSFVLEIEIPVNSTAKVSVPTLGLNAFAIAEGGKAVWKNNSYIDGVAGIAAARWDADGVTFDVGSGRYRFDLSGVKNLKGASIQTQR